MKSQKHNTSYLNNKAMEILIAIEGIPSMVDAIHTKMLQVQGTLEAQKLSTLAQVEAEKQSAIKAIHHAQASIGSSLPVASTHRKKGYSSDDPQHW